MNCSICNQPMAEPGFACPECLLILRSIVERNRPLFTRTASQRPKEQYIEAICDAFNVSERDLFNNNYCGRDLVDARHLYGYVMATVYKEEHRAICREIHRHPSNVAHGKKRVINLRKTNRDYRDKTFFVFKMIEEDTK